MYKKVRVALIGCGQISDAHLGELAHISEAKVVAVCDLEPLLAEDTAERFGVGAWYDDYKKMIEEQRPDVVHLTTPPHTHLELGSYLLEHGCNLYIEKPFCTSKEETLRLIEKAKSNNVLICAGFSQTEDIVTRRFRSFVDSGRLGDVVHIESYYGNSMDGNFSRVFLQTKNHWIHRLPGKLFQNIISHALYHIVPFFPGEIDDVVCFADDRSKNGVLMDELRVMVKSGNMTAYVTFTSSVRPITQFVRFYGTKAIVELDFDNHIFNYRNISDLPGPVARVGNAVIVGFRRMWQGVVNARNFAFGRDRFFYGMGELFKQFYNATSSGSATPPVPYEDIIRTAALIDSIVAQCDRYEKKLVSVT